MRQFLPFFLMLSLSACAGQVHKLHDLKPAATDFPSALASEYQDYADSELEQGRTSVANHFAGKGLDSLSGKPVEPEAVAKSLADANRPPVEEARSQLVKFLNDDMKQSAPQKLAHAQLLFDCWQNELQRKLDQEIAPCEAEFRSTMAELQEVSDAHTFGQQKNHVIVFAKGATALDAAGKATIDEIAAQVAGMPHYRVLLMTYTGNGKAQKNVSEARIRSVRKALVAAKVSEKHIRVKKVGGKAVFTSRDRIAPDAKKITILVKTNEAKMKVATKDASTKGEH